MIRIEIARKTPNYRRTRSRRAGPDGSLIISHEPSEAEAIAHIHALIAGGAFEGDFAMTEVRLYDLDAYRAALAADAKRYPTPFRTLAPADFARLPAGPPYSPAHGHLLALGYSFERQPDDFEDDGDGESGPHLTGGPAFDLYTSADDEIAVEQDGAVHLAPRQPEPPADFDDRAGNAD